MKRHKLLRRRLQQAEAVRRRLMVEVEVEAARRRLVGEVEVARRRRRRPRLRTCRRGSTTCP